MFFPKRSPWRWLAFAAWLMSTRLSSAQVENRPADVLAVIAGQPVTEAQLAPADRAQLARMMQQVYAVQLRALHAVLDPKLLELEAKRKGTSAADLLNTEVVSKVPQPSEAEVSAYYQERRASLNQPYAVMKEAIAQGMRNVEVQKARKNFLQSLWLQAINDGDLAVLLSPPRVENANDPARLRGDPNAPITIVEFSDFSCVFCRQAEATVRELLAKYPNQIKLAYHDFPLTELHPQAQSAAEASRCAAEQGQFWAYHDLLFANPGHQRPDDLVEDARSLKLDVGSFETCLRSGRFKPKIEQDLDLGTREGVVATPGFFINGTFVSGAQPASVFEAIIDRQLAPASEHNAPPSVASASSPR